MNKQYGLPSEVCLINLQLALAIEVYVIIHSYYSSGNWLFNFSPVYTAQTNPGRTRVRPGLKLTQVVFTRHFSKLTRVEPELVLVLFT